MSATREHRNACLIEEKITEARLAIENAGILLDELASVLPDDYRPWEVDAALDEATKAIEKAEEVASA